MNELSLLHLNAIPIPHCKHAHTDIYTPHKTVNINIIDYKNRTQITVHII